MCRCREIQSRFNWLDDKLIKDAKGRRPQHQVQSRSFAKMLSGHNFASFLTVSASPRCMTQGR